MLAVFLPLIIGVVIFREANAADPPNVYRSYQTTIYCNASLPVQTPADVGELQQIVQQAIANGQTVKAFGPKHSITDVICTYGVPISMLNIDYARVNSDGTATFGAGITLSNAMQFLEAQNLSLILVPTFGGISIGGAIGTGAHGSSLRHPSSLSDQIMRMSVIIGNGSLVEIAGSELDLFRVHLGLLGIVVDVTFKTVPLFKMTVQNVLMNDSLLFDGSIPTTAEQYDFYQLWWFPQSNGIVVGTGNYTSTETPGNAYSNFIPQENRLTIGIGSGAFEKMQKERATDALVGFSAMTELSLFKRVFGKPPIFSDNNKLANPATGYAWRLQSNLCEEKLWTSCSWQNGDDSVFPEESSVAFDISEFTGVMTMIRNIVKEYPAAFALVGLYIRFAPASPATMAISTGRTTFTVEWATPMRKDPFNSPKDGIATYQAILQEMVTNYGGRPHWGKNGLHFLSESVISMAVPNRHKFISAMKTYDPNGVFSNAFGQRMLGVSDVQDKDPQATRCALQDYCVCASNADCGPYQICGEINGFPVCKDDTSLTEGIFIVKPNYVFPNLDNYTEMLDIVMSSPSATFSILF